MKLSPPFVIRISSDRGDRYYRDGWDWFQPRLFSTMPEALSMVKRLRPFPKGQYPAVVPLIAVPSESL